MSHQKNNTFMKLLDYFAEDEEDNEEEEEIMNYEEQNNNYINSNQKKINNEKNNDINNSINSKQNEIFTELYYIIENNEDNILNYEEKKSDIDDMKGEEFNNFKAISFRPTDINYENENNNEYNNENNNEYNQNIEDEKGQNEKIIEKVQTNNWLINSNKEETNDNNNNEKQSKKEIIYNKIMTGQCSFGNFNEVSNRSTSMNTDKFGEFQQSTFYQENIDQEMYKPEYLINSKSFDELESNNTSEINNTNNNNNYKINIPKNINIKQNIIDTNTYTFKRNEKNLLNQKQEVKKSIV